MGETAFYPPFASAVQEVLAQATPVLDFDTSFIDFLNSGAKYFSRGGFDQTNRFWRRGHVWALLGNSSVNDNNNSSSGRYPSL
ncbi:hypothetical protein AGDE_16032 [Angomonas deanei]|uniref:Uncharacterized protein n=1 Tax=Angomonas deanei TaxID=59799 RepID=A0A7G2C3Q7_9TRYP|nr:hypothetical protein AGDE_16032 [Angomonas deanei]CAD2214155.1 hypothetical protein, conserved [Angomonas deanei]|eukprot:EPY17861.1 hypothetical protein AGDE_16032 [Angomonas deanei]